MKNKNLIVVLIILIPIFWGCTDDADSGTDEKIILEKYIFSENTHNSPATKLSKSKLAYAATTKQYQFCI